MRPDVTAIITTHSRPALALEALASVRAETHGSVEVVVVDDGDSFVPPAGDNTLRLVRGAHLGVARARNLGLDAARGEFVIYLDDDDVALPNRISSLLHAALESQVNLCFGMTRRVVDGAVSTLPDVPTHRIGPGTVGLCDLITCPPHVNAVLVQTETLRAVGGFDADAPHFDDWSAWLRIMDRDGEVRAIPETVAEWRLHEQGLSGTILQSGVMKARLLTLFQRLAGCLSPETAGAAAIAAQVASNTEVVLFDDFVEAMAAARKALHAQSACFGRRLPWHSQDR